MEVQPRNEKSLDKKLCSMLCQKGPDFSDVVISDISDIVISNIFFYIKRSFFS